MYEEVSFFSFNKSLDWEKGVSNNLKIVDEGLSITQTMKYAIYDSIYMGDQVGLSNIYDFTLGKNDRIYLLDETSSIWTYDYRNKHLELLIKEHQLFTNKASLASFGDLLFIAEPTGKLIAYSISNGQIMWIQSEYLGKPIYPLAISTQQKTGNIFVAVPSGVEIGIHGDKSISEDGQCMILKMNVSGEVIAAYRNESFHLKTKRKLLQAKYQFSFVVSNDGTIYLFDKESKKMFRMTEDGEENTLFSLHPAKRYSGFCIDSNNRFFLGDGRHLDVVGEDDRYLVSVNLEGNDETILTSYRGRVDKMIIDHKDNIFIWDGQQDLLSILTLKMRTMERKSTQLLEGVFISTAVDTKMERTKWHKLLVEADVPKETKMIVSYYVSDEKKIVVDSQQMDIDKILKDETVPFSKKENLLQPIWTNDISNPKDALFFNAEGRYLWFKIRLIGSEQQTPLLKKMRLYFPRTSYLSYLPAFYQEDRTSSQFLERFLSLFSKFLTEMDEQISLVPNYFDPNLVSGEFLKWLSYWLGISADDSWSDQQLRELIRHAPYLYQKRGTKEAIIKIVEIYTGERPFIIEHFQLKSYKQDSLLNRVITTLYGDHPYYFYVIVKPDIVKSLKDRMMVQKILDAEKPAFTEAKLIVLEPWIYLDMHSYLEVNTYLSERSVMTLNNKSYMPTDTVLIDLDRANRFDIHTRMELDSKLE